MDKRMLGDSFDTPAMLVQNSRNDKSGAKRPSCRSDREMVRTHFAVGDISGLIYGLHITTNRGPGSADGAHLPAITITALGLNPHFLSGAWDPAYSTYRNFKEMGRLGLDFYCREKANENRLNGKWGVLAERMTKMERYSEDEWHEEARMRSKAELPQSLIRREKKHTRLRRRVDDVTAALPKEYNGEDSLSHMSEETIAAVLAAATQNVGAARLNEALADIFVSQLRRIVTLKHLCDQDPIFDDPEFAFKDVVTVKEAEFLKTHPAPPLDEALRLEDGDNPNDATLEAAKPNNVIPFKRKPNNRHM